MKVLNELEWNGFIGLPALQSILLDHYAIYGGKVDDRCSLTMRSNNEMICNDGM